MAALLELWPRLLMPGSVPSGAGILRIPALGVIWSLPFVGPEATPRSRGSPLGTFDDLHAVSKRVQA